MPKRINKPEFYGKRFWVHQIFGLLGDKEIPELYKINQKKTLEWCKKNNYCYYLWDEKSCDKLVKTYYPLDFYELYHSVKYPIMKVDIVRFLILGVYGGLYLDMDCYPVSNLLLDEDVDFAVADTQTNKNKPYEMEVLQSKINNPILRDYINYVKTQIEEKNKIKIYDTWKCRYVYQTTGPMSLCRFLKGKQFATYKLNNPSYDGDKSLNLTGEEDFISQISCSYK